jgi:acyl carrier protein
MPKIIIIFALALTLGCSQSAERTHNAVDAPMIDEIKAVIASHFGRTADSIDSNATFAELGGDDLDLVEITMDLEDKLNVTIRDERLVEETGSASANGLCHRLTVAAFARVASTAPQSEATPLDRKTGPNGELYESQVGPYGELAKLPNPNEYELVFIPNFDDVQRFKAEEMGRNLTDSEIETLRDASVVIALPSSVAAKMTRQ